MKEGGVLSEIRDLAEIDYISGMKYKEIAEKYNISINTIKSWKIRNGWSRSSKKGAHKTKKSCTQNEKKVAHKNEEETPPCEFPENDIEEAARNGELTPKQQLFCAIYVKTFNATKAYQKAFGASYNTAAVLGSKMLRNLKVKKQIEDLKINRFNRELLSEEDIFQRYIDIAFADITDYVEWGYEWAEVPNGFGGTMSIKKNVVRFRDSKEVDGTLINEVKTGTSETIKLPDRMRALQWLTEHMDIATEKQKAEIALLKAKANLNENEIIEDDGFLEALNGTAGEDWSDEEN